MLDNYPLKVVVVDDEQAAREGLRSMLEALPGIRVVGEAADGASAVHEIRESGPDAVFLDVQMPGVSGFQVVEQLANSELPLIVFVTAYDRFAVRAFETHAIDFLLKPFTDGRLRQTVATVRERCQNVALRQSLQAQVRTLLALRREEAKSRNEPKRIAVPTGGKTILVDVAAVHALKSAGNYVEIHIDGRPLLLRSTLTALEEQLGDGHFVRIHRSTLVNVRQIEEVRRKRSGGCIVRMKNGLEFNASRSYTDSLSFRI